MPRLLNRPTISLRFLTSLDPLIHPLPPPPLRPQLPCKDKLHTKQHHAISHGDIVSNQKLSAVLRQLLFQIIQILPHVYGQAVRNGLDGGGVFGAEPARIEDREAV